MVVCADEPQFSTARAVYLKVLLYSLKYWEEQILANWRFAKESPT